MARVLGTATLVPGTGIKTVNIGIAATWANITVCEKTSGDNVNHLSLGTVVGTTQMVRSTFSDTTGSDSFNDNTKVIKHYERVAGVITPVFEASFDSFTSTQIKFNVTNATASGQYQILIEAGN